MDKNGMKKVSGLIKGFVWVFGCGIVARIAGALHEAFDYDVRLYLAICVICAIVGLGQLIFAIVKDLRKKETKVFLKEKKRLLILEGILTVVFVIILGFVFYKVL